MYLHTFYDDGYVWNKRKIKLLIIISLFENILSALLPESDLTIIPIIVLYCYIIISGTKKNKIARTLKALCTIVTVYICGLGISMVCVISLFPGYDVDNNDFSDIEIKISILILTVFCGIVYHYLYHNFFKKGITIKCKKAEKWLIRIYLMYIFIICVLFISSSMINNFNSRILQSALTFINAIFAVVFPIFIYKNRISEYFRQLNIHQEKYIAAELEYFKRYKEAQDNTRLFRHDIKNNLLCLNELLKNNSYTEAQNYLNELLNEVEGLSPKFVTGDEILDSIISAKVGVMNRENIQFSLDGVIPGGLILKPIDTCTIFANALDNAIEACQKINDTASRRIAIEIKHTEQFHLIRITNSVAKDIDTGLLFSHGISYTTKEDKSSHGIGTANILRTIEKYMGILNVSCRNKEFTLEILLKKHTTD